MSVTRHDTPLRLELLRELGWQHWVDNAKALLLLKYPQSYPPPFNSV